MYATVVVSSRQSGIGNGLTYAAPQRVESGKWKVGQLVKVPLRKRLVEGIIVDISEEKPEGDYDLKEIAGVLGDAPLLSEAQVKVARFIADYYVCSLRQALSPFLPGMHWGKLLPEKEEYVRAVSPSTPLRTGSQRSAVSKIGKKQQLLLDFMQGKEWVRWSEVQRETGVGKAILKRLLEKSIVESKTEARRGTPWRAPTQEEVILLSDVTLTPRQVAAYKAIKADPRPTLLFGITGSGKTEIYAALIRDAITEGKSAILLLPEILLTENFIERFQKLVTKDAIAIVHSRLTPSKRRDVWRRIASGEVRLVIGSRSALFSPFQNLGLIIVDEEHEWTYKNEQSPRYHAVKVAERMCHAWEGGAAPINESALRSAGSVTRALPKLLLGSATPSLESWHAAKTGRYQLVELPERFGGALLPTVRIIDLGGVQFGKAYPLSPALLEAIKQRLDRHEQSVLFLNRRGFATNLLCMECRYRFEEPQTKLPYTIHRRGMTPYLLSHHTGQELPLPETCPKCGSRNLRELGAGTQRIEVLLQEFFPEARILRADSDTLRSPEEMRSLLQKMKEGKADILLGTQSVVKGLDLPGVTLAAVLLADVGLSLPHFRAGERVFQLLTQLTGRSGRSQPGEVIIQTFRPQTMEITLAASHDVRTYMDRELLERTKAQYPPDTDLIRFVFSGPTARQESEAFLKRVRESSPGNFQISRSPSLFGGGKIWHVFLRGKGLRQALKQLPEPNATIDVDPVECL